MQSSAIQYVLPVQTQEQDCTMSGAHLPDSDCTPGHVFPGITAKEVCISGYSRSVRDVSQALKEYIYDTYNISSRAPGQYQVDHLVSLTLGGSNDIANLWPQPKEPRPGYNEKNKLTNELRRRICDGRISIQEAQRVMAEDWVEGYERYVRN
jgi:hypothetical protein